jgi:pimeloyl-ACP methyl ester carboxylesterase
MKPVVCLLSCVTLVAAEPAKRPTAGEMKAAALKMAVDVTSTKDGTPQKVVYYQPDAAARNLPGPAVPLLVFLHSWSGSIEQGPILVGLAKQRGWVFAAPDFRGINNHPEACASDLASQDIVDAVEYAKSHARIDPDRIYLVGGSGGGHMSLVMAERTPQLWAGVSAWVPISDLTAWHAESTTRKNNYAKMMEQCCGGKPGPATEAEYRHRSPLFHLAAAKGLPLDINTGIHDGHTGSVPVSQSLHAFNVVAAANGLPERQLAEADIDIITRDQKIPASLAAEKQDDPERHKAVLFRRIAGSVRVTVFEGGHDSEPSAALDWLARQHKGQPADFSLGQPPKDAPSSFPLSK